MPQTNEGILLVVGAAFFLIGLLGGGFEISAIKIPAMENWPRILSAIVGVFFMGIAVFRLFFPTVPAQLGDVATPSPTIAVVNSTTNTSIPTLELTNTPTVEVTEVVISPVPQIIVQPTKGSPLASEYLSIEGYSGTINSNGVSGTRKYSHLVTGKIKYNRVEADDDIKKVELVCENNQSDITNQFYLIPEGSIFPNYASNEIEIPANCRVDFTVIDTIFGQTGITINSIPVP